MKTILNAGLDLNYTCNWICLYCGTFTSVNYLNIFHHYCQLTICSVTPEKATEQLRGGVKSLGIGKAWESFLFLGVIPWVNARLHVRALWAECEDTDGAKTLFGTKRKHFPAPLCWLSAQSLLAFAGFSQLLHFEAVRTFSPHERLTGKSRHVPPAELQRRLTWSMQSQELATKSN